jgi:prophage regulatory protein
MTNKIYFLRKPEVLSRFEFSKSTLANKINEKTFVPPCALGERAVAWISYEIDSMAAAIVAGKSKEQLKALVADLVAQRQVVAKEWMK